jgi:hypothetical protein
MFVICPSRAFVTLRLPPASAKRIALKPSLNSHHWYRFVLSYDLGAVRVGAFALLTLELAPRERVLMLHVEEAEQAMLIQRARSGQPGSPWSLASWR